VSLGVRNVVEIALARRRPSLAEVRLCIDLVKLGPCRERRPEDEPTLWTPDNRMPVLDK
jgi:hypothetical protein